MEEEEDFDIKKDDYDIKEEDGYIERVCVVNWESPPIFFFFFLINNKDLFITKRERHPSTQEVYRGVHIKYRNYINQENPKKKKKDGFSTLRTSPLRF